MIGGGIVVLPFAMANVGIPIGISIHLFIMFVYSQGSVLLLRSKDFTGFESYAELSYVCFGRFSVFLINTLISLCLSGFIVLFMLF
jgi:amino acid permease